jgi:hypothetical protein
MDGAGDLLALAVLILIVNLPFGFWRGGLRKFTLPWLVAVHAAVPIAVLLRMLLGVGWRLSTLPILIAAYFTGQLLGSTVRGWSRGA